MARNIRIQMGTFVLAADALLRTWLQKLSTLLKVVYFVCGLNFEIKIDTKNIFSHNEHGCQTLRPRIIR